MFTGIVEATGQIRSVEELDTGRRFKIEAGSLLDGARPGDSIAIDGVCTTVVTLGGEVFTVEAVGTTLSRKTMADFSAGRRVNLERSMRLGDRLGGHLVQGHVDAVGRVTA